MIRFLLIQLLLLLTPDVVSSDHQQTDASEQTDKFSSVRDAATEVQAAQEGEAEAEEAEEEEEEGDDNGNKVKGMTEDNSRGTN